tara:strand:- start:2781 stop:3539 length:759 start_codon:yes stop_codon:yes gene_type:complete
MLDNIWSKFVKVLTRTWFYKIYNQWFWKAEAGSLEEIIHGYAKKRKGLTFVQIGANDGYHNDPLYRFVRSYDWKGILVEPQVNVFERLKNNYSDVKGLSFENAAISSNKSTIPFYKIAFSDARWATGLGSFDKNHIVQHIEKGYVDKWATREGVVIPESVDDYITSVTVETVSFDELIEKHPIKKVEGIFMDCEGFDEEVLRSIDLKKYDPSLIFFEHLHFKEDDYNQLISELEEMGYKVQKDSMDTLAYKS